jgi:hypothetical protein
MFSLWRSLWNGSLVLPRKQGPRAYRRPSFRPCLEPLEDRMMPAMYGVFAIAPALSAASMPTPSTRSGNTTPISMTVAENSPAIVINLNAAYASVSGLQQSDGMKFSILGNTNPALVQTNLSESALALTYAQGKTGTATITLCATDADGVSVKRTLQVMVLPPGQAGVVSVSSPPASPPPSEPAPAATTPPAAGTMPVPSPGSS